MNSQQKANQKSEHSSRDNSNTSNWYRKQLLNINLLRRPVTINNNHAQEGRPQENSETQINQNSTEAVFTVAKEDVVNVKVAQRKRNKLKKWHHKKNDGNKQCNHDTTPN